MTSSEFAKCKLAPAGTSRAGLYIYIYIERERERERERTHLSGSSRAR
jgi:hypothetical protein